MARNRKAHDSAHRALYTHHEVVEDLLQNFVRENWVDDLDFSTLRRESEISVLPKLKKRERDVVWSVTFAGKQLYILLLLEFQARPERLMALRQVIYVATFYQELYRQKRIPRRGKLPPVLPIVLYTGTRPWRVPLSVEDLVAECPEALRRHQLRMSYTLIDELRTPVQLGAKRNTVAGSMLLQRQVGEEAAETVARICTWFQREDHESLRRAFRDFIFEYTDENNAAALVHLLDHPEDPMTTKQRWQQYTRNLRDEGRLEGRQEGQQSTQVRMLTKLLRLKFPGVPTAAYEGWMTAGTAADFDRWAERVLTAQSVDEVFAPPFA